MRFPFFKILPLLLLVFSSSGVNAFQVQQTDSSDIEVRTVQESELERYQEDPDFNYEKDYESSEPWIFLLLGWVLSLMSEIFGNQYGDFVLKLILIIFFVIALALLLNALFTGNLTSSFTSKNASKKLSIELDKQHIHSVDLGKDLDKAIQKKNFRLAAKFLYLMVLRSLDDSEIIDWKADKTNHEYLTEISNSSIRNLFSKLTLYYDYTEYGDFEIDADRFLKMRSVYSDLLQHIRINNE